MSGLEAFIFYLFATLAFYSPRQASITWIDDSSEARVIVAYRNDTAHNMCFDPSGWPNAAGYMPLSNLDIHLSVAGQDFPMDRDPEYCPGCEVRIPSHTSIIGFMPYSVFKLPRDLYGQSKQLSFHPIAYPCR